MQIENVKRLHTNLITNAVHFDVWIGTSHIQGCILSMMILKPPKNKEVALAWVLKGGDCLHDEFPDEFEDDVDIFLEIATHNPHDFWCALEALYSNKDFMLQAVERNGQLLSEATSALAKDFDLALVAFSTTPDLPSRYDIGKPDKFAFITQFAKQVRRKIMDHDNFHLILCGMSVAKPGKKCRLPRLDQGKETAMAYKHVLAEYVGIPKGIDLKQLRQVSENLAKWGY